MEGWKVTPEAVEKLQLLATQLTSEADKVSSSLAGLKDDFDANRPGLGKHAGSIAQLLDDLHETEKLSEQAVKKLAIKAQRAAMIRRRSIEENPYQSIGSSDYQTPYSQTTYSSVISYTDPKSKQRIERVSTRTVYENSQIDPSAVIPAGTKYANGYCLKEDTTNIALMEQGKAPFVAVTNPDGSKSLVPVELHHLSGKETHRGSVYFTGEERDGSIVEIASTVHDTYSGQLHIGNPSFRRDAGGEKTGDAAKYEKFRKEYWKHRAQKFRKSQQK